MQDEQGRIAAGPEAPPFAHLPQQHSARKQQQETWQRGRPGAMKTGRDENARDRQVGKVPPSVEQLPSSSPVQPGSREGGHGASAYQNDQHGIKQRLRTRAIADANQGIYAKCARPKRRPTPIPRPGDNNAMHQHRSQEREIGGHPGRGSDKGQMIRERAGQTGDAPEPGCNHSGSRRDRPPLRPGWQCRQEIAPCRSSPHAEHKFAAVPLDPVRCELMREEPDHRHDKRP